MTAAVWALLRPKALSAVHRGTRGRSPLGRPAAVLLGGVGAFALVYWVALRLLRAVREVEDIGPLLSTRLLGLALLLFLAILLLSNLIGALSSYFLARDLPGILAAPVDWLALYGARLGETLLSSSWMVVLLLAPIVAAYASAFGADASFYLLAAVALVPFLVIPAALGAAATLVLVRLLPARRTRELLGWVTLAGAALLVAALRLLRPERLVRPEGFRSLVDFLAVLDTPASPWLPSEWVASALGGALQGAFDPFWLLLLWSTAGGTVVLGAVLHGRWYARGFTRAQEGVDAGRRSSAGWRWLGRSLRALGPAHRALVLKDARIFFRDSTQWSQLLILAVLLLVYVYNMQVLPLRSSEAIGRFLVSAVVFLNVGLAGFVLVAVAARFVFPAFSLEGRTLWLLRSAPLDARALLWSKYWTGVVPLLVLALALTGVTNWILGAAPALFVLALVTVTAVTLAAVAQALAWGIAFPKFEAENAAQIPTSMGGLLYMVGALATLAGVLTLQVWALRAYLRSGLPRGVPREPLAGEVGVALLGTVLICGVAAIVPYRFAAGRLARGAEGGA